MSTCTAPLGSANVGNGSQGGGPQGTESELISALDGGNCVRREGDDKVSVDEVIWVGEHHSL